jgi:hypothetical protein
LTCATTRDEPEESEVRTPRKILLALRSAGTATKVTLAGAVLLLTGGALTAPMAAEKTAVATPTITSHPTNPATATTATFDFTDATVGVSFECSLDGAAFTACTSPKTYAGPLALGSHTFNVRARKSNGQLSSTAGYTWTIVVTAPTLTGTPTDPTSATSATFAFADPQPGVSFECSLDGAAYAACTSPKSYAGPLSQGLHNFNVRARNSVGYLSAPTTFSWRVDRTPPPAPTLTSKPADPTNQRTATFSFADAESGVSYLCRLDDAAFAVCVSPKTYDSLGQGAHSFAVDAVDAAGNVSAATSYSWTVDLIAPPTPSITSGPAATTTDTTASFTFTDAEPGVSYQCRLDGGTFGACTSPKSYTGLSVGGHAFEAQAVDRAGNGSISAGYSWNIVKPVTGFTLSGDVTQLLSPGATAELNVKITNPFNFDILVSQLTVTVQHATTRNGQPNPSCDGTANLRVSRQFSGSWLKVKSNRTVSLSDLGVPHSQWPQLLMPDLPTNQDACKGASYTFTYSATATKATS